MTPFVVEVDKAGEVRAVGEAMTPYRPTDAQIAFHLSHFISNVRSLAVDPVIVRQSWLDAYQYTTDRGAATFNDYARANDPFARVGELSVSVEITSVVRASDDSFQVRWVERSYSHGALAIHGTLDRHPLRRHRPPTTEERLRKNPFGIYVNGLSWSKELGVF